ncbi:hypothetical protein V5279_13230 [Bradyrhizobium sp. 26S5]|uniref:hypothetical protein n=1 Tax=unclassified Bradyrhizobium TaxID=2631580 RepID=UPI0014088F11|nr:hypothetical protein [Bradyrhizobium sp. 2S1]MCK7668422.1 hypothetical protein [Bradyrhizobium sp. 2S1]
MSATVFHIWFYRIFYIWAGVSGILYLLGLMLRYKMLQHRFPRRSLTFWELWNLPRADGFVFLTDPTDFDLTGRIYRKWVIRVETPLLIWFSLGAAIAFVIHPK